MTNTLVVITFIIRQFLPLTRLCLNFFIGVAHASIDAPPPMNMGNPLLILGDLCVLGALVVSF